MTNREGFERRLLALVRDYFDETDGLYPGGYEVGDFMLLYEIYPRTDASELLKPWNGGVRAGFDSPHLASSTTNITFWQTEAMLREALYRVRQTRQEYEAGQENDDVEEDA